MSTLPNMSILASAGTGKTFQLSDRIVQPLALGVKHEEIAALTFTRAAAAEFIVKVIAKLREAAENDAQREELCRRLGLDPRQFGQERFRTMLRQALLSSNRLTMGTLDSFFAKLVNNFPLEVGLERRRGDDHPRPGNGSDAPPGGPDDRPRTGRHRGLGDAGQPQGLQRREGSRQSPHLPGRDGRGIPPACWSALRIRPSGGTLT
jgi:hypothetical protein